MFYKRHRPIRWWHKIRGKPLSSSSKHPKIGPFWWKLLSTRQKVNRAAARALKHYIDQNITETVKFRETSVYLLWLHSQIESDAVFLTASFHRFFTNFPPFLMSCTWPGAHIAFSTPLHKTNPTSYPHKIQWYNLAMEPRRLEDGNNEKKTLRRGRPPNQRGQSKKKLSKPRKFHWVRHPPKTENPVSVFRF